MACSCTVSKRSGPTRKGTAPCPRNAGISAAVAALQAIVPEPSGPAQMREANPGTASIELMPPRNRYPSYEKKTKPFSFFHMKDIDCGEASILSKPFPDWLRASALVH